MAHGELGGGKRDGRGYGERESKWQRGEEGDDIQSFVHQDRYP